MTKKEYMINKLFKDILILENLEFSQEEITFEEYEIIQKDIELKE